MGEVSFDVVPLIAGALMEERDHWRESAAAELSELTMFIQGRIKPRPHRSLATLKADAKRIARQLGDALDGNVFCSGCDVCGEPLRNGQGSLRDVDFGEIHASCTNPFGVKLGDIIDCGPEIIAWDDEDEAAFPGGKPSHLTAGEVTPLYTTEQMRAVIARAHAAIANPKAPTND